jgi:hypothetical protein
VVVVEEVGGIRGENREKPESKEEEDEEEEEEEEEEKEEEVPATDSPFTPFPPCPSLPLLSLLVESATQDLVIAKTSTSSSGNFMLSPNQSTGKLSDLLQYRLFLLIFISMQFNLV